MAPLQPNCKDSVDFTNVHTVYPSIFKSLVLDMVDVEKGQSQQFPPVPLGGHPKKCTCPGPTSGYPPVSDVPGTPPKGGSQEAVLLSAHITSTDFPQ